MSSIELAIGSAVFGTFVTFVVALRWVSRRMRTPVPAATVVAGDARWLEGQTRARLAGRFEAFHRVAVAFALTSIVIMVACFVVMIVAIAAG